jgi:hypothetical protein
MRNAYTIVLCVNALGAEKPQSWPEPGNCSADTTIPRTGVGNILICKRDVFLMERKRLSALPA